MQTQSNQDELQKAIDDITNSNTPVAPADDAQPLAMPDPIDVGMPGQMPPAPEVASVDAAAAMPEIAGAVDMSAMTETAGAAIEETAVDAAVAEPAASEAVVPEMTIPEAPATETTVEATEVEETVAPVEAVPEVATEEPTMEAPAANGDLEKVKNEALRDLSPLMEKMDIAPEKKFRIYKDMMRANNDKSVVMPAYEAAKQIADEQERGEALLSLIEYIDESE